MARQPNKQLCITRYVEDVEEAEWQNEADVDTGKLTERASKDMVSTILIDNMEEWMEQTCLLNNIIM